MMNKLSKSNLILYLNKHYQCYLEEKKLLLNHPKIIEYLFNKPSINILSISDLVCNYDSYIRIVRLEYADTKIINSNFIILLETLRLYSIKYGIYKKNKSKHLKLNYLPNIFNNSYQQTIMKNLDKLEYQNIISYVYKWSFKQKGEHTSLIKSATINIHHSHIYDFYGIIINYSQMNQFVILYDDDTHFDNKLDSFTKIHVNDIYVQFVLFQMNIHLLRLTKNSNIKKEIFNFVKIIKNTTNYITINPIKPEHKIFKKSIEIFELQEFSHDYNYNHIIFNKNPIKEDEIFDSEDDKFINKLITKKIYDKPADNSFNINDKLITKIISKNEKLYNKKSEADKYLVELICENNDKLSINKILKEKSKISTNNITINEDKILKYVYSNVKPKNMIMNNDVKNILKNYKPKKVDLTAYTKLKKLKGYKLMNNIDELYPTETYIKYILMSDVGNSDNIKLHVKGGILLNGGIFINNKFKKIDDLFKWTHLLLFFAPFPIKEFEKKNIYDYKQHPFYLKINTHYIFYKYFNHK